MASQITSFAIVYSAVYSRRRSKKTSNLRVTGLCAENSPVTGELPVQMASNTENVSIWWRHYVFATKDFKNAFVEQTALSYIPKRSSEISGSLEC